MMPGGAVHSRDMEQFRAVVEGRDVDNVKAGFTAQQSTPTEPVARPTPMAGFGKRGGS